MTTPLETDLAVGPASINAYSRLNYTMWHALAEFIDNSTQSRLNYDAIVDEVLKKEGSPLIVRIDHNKLARTITIEDNSIGMTKDDLIAALKIAHPTKDSKGRSKYGMGMKTSACWIGKRWRIVTCEWGSGEEWTAEVDVEKIANAQGKVPLHSKSVSKDAHYTKVIIEALNRNIQTKTVETIKEYLGSMYRFDLAEGRLKLLYDNEPINAQDEWAMDTDEKGKPYKSTFQTEINGKKVSGWFGVLKKGGRKHGGFSLFQNRRQIQGYPHAWKPRSIYGGVDDEGANNLVAQRLTGVIELDGFDISHTKDAILFKDDEEDTLDTFLVDETKAYREYAKTRRGSGSTVWTKDKLKDLADSMRSEFGSSEFKDAVANTSLPPIEVIQQNNQKQASALTVDDKLPPMQILPELAVTVAVQERSEHDPYLTIVADAAPGALTVIINRLHPYYQTLETAEAVGECIRQYIYDAIAEYKVAKLIGRINPDTVHRLKDACLRANDLRAANNAAQIEASEAQRLKGAKDGTKAS